MKAAPGKAGRVRYDWWRAHHGLPGHAKWRAVARSAQVPISAAFHIVVCLLDTASRGQPRGSIAAFKPFDCAGIVDIAVDKVDRVVEVLRDIHWIEGHMIAEWDDRQPQREDAGAARRALEYRSRIQSVTDEIVTHAKRDGPAPSRIPSVTNHNVTTASAPDKDKKISSSFLTAASPPVETSTEQAEAKTEFEVVRPSDLHGDDLKAAIERRQARDALEAGPLSHGSVLGPTAGKYAGWVYLKAGTPEFEAHSAARGARSLAPPPQDKNGGWMFETRWPPGFVPPAELDDIPKFLDRRATAQTQQ